MTGQISEKLNFYEINLLKKVWLSWIMEWIMMECSYNMRALFIC